MPVGSRSSTSTPGSCWSPDLRPHHGQASTAAAEPGIAEDLLTTLSGHTFSDAQVVDTYRAFSSFCSASCL